ENHGGIAGEGSLDRLRLLRSARFPLFLYGGRVVPHRRRGDHRSRGVCENYRPDQGFDQIRRRVDQLRRFGKRPDGPPRRGGGGGDRRSPSQVAGTPAGGGGAQGGGPGDGGGTDSVPGSPIRQVVVARRGRLCRGNSPDFRREIPQGPTAGAV